MNLVYCRPENLPEHVRLDFKEDYFEECRSNKHYCSLKRNQDKIIKERYPDIHAVVFPNCIKFFITRMYGPTTYEEIAFACYDPLTETLYRFNNYIVSISVDNQLIGTTKEDIINELMGR